MLFEQTVSYEPGTEVNHRNYFSYFELELNDWYGQSNYFTEYIQYVNSTNIKQDVYFQPAEGSELTFSQILR